MPTAKVALIIGAGDATGGAIARRFAREGYTACVTRRTADKLVPLVKQIEAAGGKAHGIASDARKEEDMVDLFARIERDIGTVEVAVFNVGGNVRFPIRETTTRVYTKVWEMTALGGFHLGREAAKVMVPRGRGTILFTGATASVRGGAGFAAFSGGKHALRSLSQCMARELGPQGIHVAHMVIDGGINTDFIKQMRPNDYDSLVASDGLLSPDAIADQYWHLHCQPRSAWTYELDIRPWSEKW
jgi:NAD(P)-dependent dehydrogenase (short-subunit alcohol dehydrogenase family)